MSGSAHTQLLAHQGDEEEGVSYHGDQEQVRGRHMLQVVWVSMAEPLDVHQGKHHSTRGDARLPGWRKDP